MNLALLFAFGAMLFWGVGDFLIQRSTRKIGDIEILTWIGIIATIVLLPFVWNDIVALGVLGNLALVVILGIVTFGMSIFDLEALKIGKISVVDMVLSLELPLTILLGVFFFYDTLSIWQVIIILILMWGVGLIAIAPQRIRFSIEKGALLAFVGAILMALVNFLTAMASRRISPWMAIWAPSVIFTAICIVILWKRHGPSVFATHFKKYRTLIIATGVVDTIAWVFYAGSTAHGELSIVTAITESYPAIAVMLGVWLNRERIQKQQWLGVAIALAASFMLAMTL